MHCNMSNWVPSSTERTYVKGLQELIDISIKPVVAPVTPVNILGGVNSTKETIIPAAERRIAFSSLDSLFLFIKIYSFLLLNSWKTSYFVCRPNNWSKKWREYY